MASVGTVRFALALLAAVLLATSCTTPAGGPVTEGYPLTVRNCGRTVTFEQPPERVLVIGGEAGSMMHAAGAAGKITTFGPVQGEPLGAAADALSGIPRIEVPGSGEVSREAIIAEQPDLVLTFGLTDINPEDLAAAGIATLFVSGRCDEAGAPQSGRFSPLRAMLDDIALYGKIFGTQRKAEASIAGLRERIDDVRRRADERRDQTGAALFVTDAETPIGAYGGLSMVDEQLAVLGLRNVFGDTEQRYFDPSVETLIASAPEQVLVLYQASSNTAAEARRLLTSRAELAGIPAIAGNRVLALDFFYTGNGVLAVDGLELLADQLGG